MLVCEKCYPIKENNETVELKRIFLNLKRGSPTKIFPIACRRVLPAPPLKQNIPPLSYAPLYKNVVTPYFRQKCGSQKTNILGYFVQFIISHGTWYVSTVYVTNYSENVYKGCNIYQDMLRGFGIWGIQLHLHTSTYSQNLRDVLYNTCLTLWKCLLDVQHIECLDSKAFF